MEIEEIHLNSKKLNHCIVCGNGWGTCRSEGACVLKDDFTEIYRKLVEADDANAERFKDVINYAAADVERLKKAERE